MALQNPTGTGAAQGFAFLYPYDQTVFPRGLLAPLLQWTWSMGDADAIQLQLTTSSGSFSWTGTFGRPAILAMTGGKFIRMPIPQDVWAMATATAGGVTPSGKLDQLTLSLVVAKSGVGYGPITETWTVAPALLVGTVYYNSYGTQLVKNSLDSRLQRPASTARRVWASTRARPGRSSSRVSASPPGSGHGCRVCHVASSDGSTLIAQSGNPYSETHRYDLKNGNAENALASYDNIFGWAGLSADGSLAFTNAGDLAANDSVSQLYAFPPAATGAKPIAATGIPSNLTAGTPAFSPDTKHIAFDFLGGTIGTVNGNGTQLVALDFDATTNAFSNLKVLATMTGGMRAGFPSFFPTDDAVAFHYQIVNSNHLLNTWHGAEAQIWWSDLATGTASSLYALNGLNAGGATSYLPTGAEQPRERRGAQLRADGQPGGLGWLHLDRLHEPAPLRKRGHHRSVAERSARLRRDAGGQCDDEEALGRRDRSQRTGGDGPEPSGLLPSGAGAARRERARVLGARSVPPRWAVVHERRPVLQRILRARHGRRGARLHEHATERSVLTAARALHDGGRLLPDEQHMRQRVLRGVDAALSLPGEWYPRPR